MSRLLFPLTLAVLWIASPTAPAQVSTDRAIDRLVGLLHDRLALARGVAEAKFNSKSPIEDLRREAVVREAAVRQAKLAGLDASTARALFGAQIEASKRAQRVLISEWRGRPPIAHAPDLARDIRPKLDDLTTRIIRALAAALPLDSAVAQRAVRAAARRHRFRRPEAREFHDAWNIAVSPLVKP